MESLNYNVPVPLEMLGMEALPDDWQRNVDNLDGTCAVVSGFLFAVQAGKIFVKVYIDIDEIDELKDNGFTQGVHPIGLRAYLRNCFWFQSVFDSNIEDFPPYFKNLYTTFLESNS